MAITILMIAIAGPLSIASKGLFGAEISKNQMIASYLAHETMELVKNIKDNNVISNNLSGWLASNILLDSCTSVATCDVSALDMIISSPNIVKCSGTYGCQLYLNSSYGYEHTNTSGDTMSKFSRYFYLHTPNNTTQCASLEECGVTVVVSWNDGGNDYDVKITSEITSSVR